MNNFFDAVALGANKKIQERANEIAEFMSSTLKGDPSICYAVDIAALIGLISLMLGETNVDTDKVLLQMKKAIDIIKRDKNENRDN